MVRRKRSKSNLTVKDYKEDIIINPCQCDNISDKNFFIPNYDQYEMLVNYNYKIKQLQQICKFYKQKTTGKKLELLNNIYHYLKLSFFSIKIQKISRGFLLRLNNFYRGPAYFKRNLCNNDTDFFTLENMKDIDNAQFISYENSNGIIYGYDIVSLYNLILKNGKNTKNPYDRGIFPNYLLNNIKKLRSISYALNYDMKVNIKNEIVEDKKKSIEFKLISIFQKIDEHGFITNLEWFNSLSRNGLVRYIRELGDIWNYRAQLSMETKVNICPPSGNPFIYFNTRDFYNNNNIDQIKLAIIKVMECLVNNGNTQEYKALGAFYILSALTLVSSNAADSLPWLYQSVMHH